MSKSMVHVLIPYTTEVACGMPGHMANAGVREDVTCKRCKKTDQYKKLPNAKKVKR
ncbi:hypothetical protein [Pseudomonas serbica]|uniref:hypothetical protein n=1 Tax=Pseudomonas serbica TaxID=2965074 RepID=UPI00237C1CB3|nr:hypothetical protein [Pseudomonas serbica]